MTDQQKLNFEAFIKRNDVLAAKLLRSIPVPLRTIDPTIAVRKFREGKAESYSHEILRRYKLRGEIPNQSTKRSIQQGLRVFEESTRIQ